MIYVIGHKNPDADSIFSAIVMADFLKQKLKKAQAVRSGKINKETEFILKKAEIGIPPLIKSLVNKKVFLVDHNEISQSIDGIENSEIVGILDHHKLGGIETKEPIFVRIEPVGSSSTVIFNLFSESKIKIKKNQALLLMAGIIIDTLKLTSPTTVNNDKIALKKLAKIANVNINKISKEIFEIKSDVSGIKIKDLILSDYKDFKEKNIIFGVGVHETTNPKNVLLKQEEIFKELAEIKKAKAINLIFFALVDIFRSEAWFFLLSKDEKNIIKKAFKKQSNSIDNSKQSLVLLPGIVSRKKQMIPLILKNL